MAEGSRTESQYISARPSAPVDTSSSKPSTISMTVIQKINMRYVNKRKLNDLLKSLFKADTYSFEVRSLLVELQTLVADSSRKMKQIVS